MSCLVFMSCQMMMPLFVCLTSLPTSAATCCFRCPGPGLPGYCYCSPALSGLLSH